MQLLHLLTLATTASAISIRFWHFAGAQSGNNCGLDGAMGCENIQPNVCCYTGRAYGAVGLYNVPNGWKVYYKAYKEKICSGPALFDVDRIDGTSPCNYNPKGGDVSSAFYAFRNSKAKRGGGGECQKADTLYMADGAKYSIGHLEDGMRQHLVRRSLAYVTMTC
jgi:hypothetical protein